MPELPEVETVKNQLKKRLIGKSIKQVKINYNQVIEYPSVTNFSKNIINQEFIDIKRRGKWLIFELNDYYLLSHLRMEGKYNFRNKNDIINKHEHIIFTLNDDIQLRYQDTRKFGKMHLIEKDKIDVVGPLIKLGLEPWDERLDKYYLKKKYMKKSIPIKTLLLDQNIIAGIGNIYADEILFLSNINPYTKSSQLSDNDLDNIIKNTKIILEKAIKLGGTTIHTFSSVDGLDGKFQNELLVHGLNICPNCHNKITKEFIGGRGTYYCKNCQK